MEKSDYVIILLLVLLLASFIIIYEYKNTLELIIKHNNNTAKENYRLKKQINNISDRQIYDLRPKG